MPKPIYAAPPPVAPVAVGVATRAVKTKDITRAVTSRSGKDLSSLF